MALIIAGNSFHLMENIPAAGGGRGRKGGGEQINDSRREGSWMHPAGLLTITNDMGEIEGEWRKKNQRQRGN